jgi:hypothetical protein
VRSHAAPDASDVKKSELRRLLALPFSPSRDILKAAHLRNSEQRAVPPVRERFALSRSARAMAGAGRLRPTTPSGVPALFSSTVKDQNVQLTIEAARKIQKHSKDLVRDSSTLIATAISLVDDARAACGQSKAKKPRSRNRTN